MSKEDIQNEGDTRARTRAKRPVPPAPNTGKSFNGWFFVLIVIVAMLLSRTPDLFSSGDQLKDISQTQFEKAVVAQEIVSVARVRETETASTYLLGTMRSGGIDNAAGTNTNFRVRLVPGENEDLMNFICKQGLSCPVKEKTPMIGAFMQQLLIMGGVIALLWFIFYRRVEGAGGLFAIGKSRAKMPNGDQKHKVTFNDVAGVDEAKEEVQEIVEFLKAPAKFTKLGGRIPKGVLLVGPPGTGKTLLAKAIAGEAKVPFFSMSGSDFEEMFVGVGASRVRDMFAQAKKAAPCLLFIDEIDAVGAKRTGATALGTHGSDQTLNAMLVEMDGFDANEGVIIIAATNRPDVLDPALLRPGRFDRQIYVDLPTLKGREDILRLHGAKITFAPDADLVRIARGTPGFSGADLANLLNEAALLAVRQGLEGVTHAILEEARDKVLWGRERKSANLTAKDREITAWHEAGHAILQLLLPHADPLHKVTIIPRGRALGATMALPEKDVLNRTKNYFLDEMCICCGGRIAEELVLGDISTGAAQDIRQATQIARSMICCYGMSETFGFQSFEERSQFSAEPLPPPFSEQTAQGVDAEVKKLIDTAYARAEKILAENRDKLEKLAQALLENESMDGRDIEFLLGIPPKNSTEKTDNENAKNVPDEIVPETPSLPKVEPEIPTEAKEEPPTEAKGETQAT